MACASKPVVQLAVGQYLVIDPGTTTGCLRVPAAGAAGAEYLLVLASGSGVRSAQGISGPYLLRASSPLTSVVAAGQATTDVPALAPGRVSNAARFDAMLRERERVLAADPLTRPVLVAPVEAAPPQVGDSRSFKVCTTLSCSATGMVQATAKFVGAKVAVFLDDNVPNIDPLQPADFVELGTAFDTYHYPIDTTSFGRESDQDGNGVVIILMTDAVNDLTPDCTDGRVIGYFFGGDLGNGANSNHGEIFYTLVPSPSTPKCTAINRRQAVDNLKPTLIHEFQHMISFNQHVLIRGGGSEETWLNEALSHFAEELGGRLIPNTECMPAFTSCRSQYTSGDIINAYDYLKDPEAHFLVFPGSTPGTLEERGAAWLFLRWTLDQFAADTITGIDLTRKLDQTTLTGVTNITGATGGDFATMDSEFLMAAYLDDGPDLPSEPTGRLRLKSWGLRSIWTDPRNQAPSGPFNGFPVVPTSIGSSFSRTGSLKQGSGRHFLIVQPAQGAALDLQVLANGSGGALDPALAARFGIVRVH